LELSEVPPATHRDPFVATALQAVKRAVEEGVQMIPSLLKRSGLDPAPPATHIDPSQVSAKQESKDVEEEVQLRPLFDE